MPDYLKYINLGLTLVSPAIVGVIIGKVLDGTFRTFPLCTVGFLMLGIVSGIWSMYKSVMNMMKGE